MKKIRKVTFDRFSQFVFTFREVFKLAWETQPKYLIAVFVIGIFSGLLIAPTLYLQKLIIDVLVKGATTGQFDEVFHKLLLYLIATISLGFIQILINRGNGFMEGILQRGFYAELEIRKSKKLASLDMATIESSSFEDRYVKIDQESNRAYSLIPPVAGLPGNIVSLATAISLLIPLSPFAALAILLSTLPRVLTNSRLIRERFDLSTQLSPIRKIQGWLNYYLLRNRNYMELKLLDLVPFLAKKYEKNSREILDLQASYGWKWEKSTLLSFLPLTVADGAITIWIAYLTLMKIITVGSFQLYFSALKRVQSEFQQFTSSLFDIYENYLYVSELVWFLNLEPKIDSNAGGKKFEAEPLLVEFKNVWFKYKKGQKWTLRDVNLVLKEGEHLAIVGLNGAGKSTLLKLLARFYDPQKGEILINGRNLKEFDVDEWRNRMAVLFQEFETYPFSAQESIGYGDTKNINNLPEIVQAATSTGINEFIESLPAKYKTPLHPEFKGGVRPSIGQWQRIGISRMLFRKSAKIIVMDEPTSSVDPEAEEQIFNELSRLAKNKILVFVTQRFSTVRIADRIILIGNGKILEQGTHKELMKLKGKYHELFELQAKGYK